MLRVNVVWGDCADLDSQACVDMKLRNPAICDDAIGRQVCPKFCGLCAVSCIHCVDILTNYTQCTDVQLCQAGQKCLFAELYNTADGSRSYKMSCADIDACSGSGLLGILGRRRSLSINSDCCDTDMCNYPPHFTTTSAPPNGHGGPSHAVTDDPVAITTKVGIETGPTTSTVHPMHTNQPTTLMASTTTTPKPIPVCNRDIQFMIQDSRTQQPYEIELIRNLLTAFVSAISIGLDNNIVDFALLQHHLVIVKSPHHPTFQDLLNTIAQLPFHTKDTGITASEISHFLMDHHKNEIDNGRIDVANVVIFVVDQNANLILDHHNVLPDLSALSNNVIVVNIGGSPSAGGFTSFASSPSRILSVASYLQILSALPNLLQLVCS